MVVSPQNPFKKSETLLNERHRISLVDIALEGDYKIRSSAIECKLPKPSFTVNTLKYLEEQHPENEYVIIMGSDGFSNLKNWKNFEYIIQNYTIYIYKRDGFEINNILNANIKIIDAPLLLISSTYIRKLIKEKKDIRYLVPDVVREEIERKGYYQSISENYS
jgi:nicotinate-nucleotide adenylyltransferase